jgi:hypothetical protein
MNLVPPSSCFSSAAAKKTIAIFLSFYVKKNRERERKGRGEEIQRMNKRKEGKEKMRND